MNNREMDDLEKRGAALDCHRERFQEAFDSLLEMSQITSGDVTSILGNTPQGLSPRERRSAVRAVFACFEAITFAIKQYVLRSTELSNLLREVNGEPPVVISDGERAVAEEVTYALSSEGSERQDKMRLSCTANIKFALNFASRGAGSTFLPTFGDNRWDKLRKAVSVRDRLMHPKQVKDLSVSDEELLMVIHAFDWFHVQTTSLLRADHRAISNRIAKMGCFLEPRPRSAAKKSKPARSNKKSLQVAKKEPKQG